ncbi:hypothetical protein FPQ14_03035 [Gilliamella apicola]|uniref:Tetratricopeptide repeat protein n=1 Tax=Gilliamella apicola TaxID=1196095 RepID=A0A556RTJ6_9GAMM|nr:hypothetical protein [Gilliamella apicola]TSJ92236.1 hypothetical protein FPQ14_03035 [Gilliamella apicola]
MRTIIAIFFIFLLTACHTRTAEDAFKEGSYIESINLLTASLDEKGPAKFDQNDAKRLQTIVSSVMQFYEKDLNHFHKYDYPQKIDAYKHLLTMKEILSNRFYSDQISFFNDKYDIRQLKQTLAKEYYDYGNYISGTDSESYRTKAELYKNSLSYDNYKNAATLYKNANTKYMQMAAKNYYEQGKQFEQQGNYKAASEAFSQASSVYKPLGKYKDSDKQAIDNDKKYCTQQAEEAYQEAKQLAMNATKRYEYREVAKYYARAASIYRPYGQYLDASSLAETYEKKGLIKVYCYSSSFIEEIRNQLSANYIKFVNYSRDADLDIKIDYDSDFVDHGKSVENENKIEQVFDKYVEVEDKDGNKLQVKTYKDQKYNLQTVTYKNKLTLTAKMEVHGIYSYSKSFEVEETSVKHDYIYSGDVPSRFYNHSDGRLKSEDDLYTPAKSNLLTEVKSKLDDIAKDLSYL